MFTRRHGACAGGRGIIPGLAFELAHVRGGGQRGVGQGRHAGRLGVDQLLLTAVPVGEHYRVGQATDQSGVDQAGKVDPGNVPRAGEHAFEIPDGFLCAGKVIREESATVLPREETVEAPHRFGLGADVQQVDHQQIPGSAPCTPTGPDR